LRLSKRSMRRRWKVCFLFFFLLFLVCSCKV
jgi:hypothetical protein